MKSSPNSLKSLRGPVIGRNHPEYEDARKLYNAMIDKRPLLIARCADVADVIAAVNFGRDNKLPIAIRGGGHNGPGLGSVDDGLVIDLSTMKGVRVDPKNKTVRVGPGCTTGDVDHATQAFGQAVPFGILSTTGVAGLTLSGGHGYLSRQYGLAVDSLLEADVVLADGSFVTASETENADLLWALRGGGGNFGVVTSFLFRTHPVSMIYGGPIVTANAFASVSLDPMLVLVCVDHATRTHAHLHSKKRFGINVLCEDQRGISEYYARRSATMRMPRSRLGPVSDGPSTEPQCYTEPWRTWNAVCTRRKRPGTAPSLLLRSKRRSCGLGSRCCSSAGSIEKWEMYVFPYDLSVFAQVCNSLKLAPCERNVEQQTRRRHDRAASLTRVFLWVNSGVIGEVAEH